MSREFQLKEIEGKKCITFPFQSVREVDDIILQLLNDADLDGFLKSRIVRSEKEIIFDTEDLTSLDEIPAKALQPEQFIHVLEDLDHMLVYLEDSFIGPEYVSFDARTVFTDPETDKLYLTVLPLQNPGHADFTMQDLIKYMISKFSPEKPDAFYDFAASKAAAGISKITELESLISSLKEEEEKLSLVAEEVPAVEEAAEELPAVEEIAEELPAVEEMTEELPVVEEVAEELPAIEEVAAEFSAAEEATAALPAIEKVPAEDALAVEDVPDRTMVFDKQTGDELNAALAAVEAALPPVTKLDLHDSELPEVSELEAAVEQTPELSEFEKAVEETPVVSELAKTEEEALEAAEEIAAEPEPAEEVAAESEPVEEIAAVPIGETVSEPEQEQTAAEVIAEEIPAESEPEIVSSRPAAYLFRKKSSELIQLDADPFVIGKIPMACDYIITDNPALSRIHAIIRYVEEEEAYYIIDCNSTNHVYVNGIRVTGQQIAKLADKDRIHLATEAFVFHLQK